MGQGKDSDETDRQERREREENHQLLGLLDDSWRMCTVLEPLQ